ncbi:MAG: hydrogenase expression/formation protein [Burkholderiales bacterium]|nr:hydrogenase expression/formation protein [Burkholderiales bacterium]
MHKPFPIPVVAALGPGSQDEDQTLDYLSMPQGMDTYRPPVLPEPEELAAHGGARQLLQHALASLQALLRGEPVAPLSLAGLADEDRLLVNQVLGEGEVSAQVLPAAGHATLRAQESVFAGVWRVFTQQPDGTLHDHIELGAVPQALREAARSDGAAPPPLPTTWAPQVMNAPALVSELADHSQRWRPGDVPHVVNLSLLPLAPADIAALDQWLGTGRVLVLSRGYGNCRITSTCVKNTWRVVYYNSQDAVILNAVEVTDMPDVACAAVQDLHDSAERLGEVLAWMVSP